MAPRCVGKHVNTGMGSLGTIACGERTAKRRATYIMLISLGSFVMLTS